MDIRTLEHFLVIAREESITAAADTLHVSQPALSRQLKELEKEMEKKLFVRERRGISLTEDGLLLKKRAERLIDFALIVSLPDTEDKNTTTSIYQRKKPGEGLPSVLMESSIQEEAADLYSVPCPQTE